MYVFSKVKLFKYTRPKFKIKKSFVLLHAVFCIEIDLWFWKIITNRILFELLDRKMSKIFKRNSNFKLCAAFVRFSRIFFSSFFVKTEQNIKLCSGEKSHTTLASETPKRVIPMNIYEKLKGIPFSEKTSGHRNQSTHKSSKIVLEGSLNSCIFQEWPFLKKQVFHSSFLFGVSKKLFHF